MPVEPQPQTWLNNSRHKIGQAGVSHASSSCPHRATPSSMIGTEQVPASIAPISSVSCSLCRLIPSKNAASIFNHHTQWRDEKGDITRCERLLTLLTPAGLRLSGSAGLVLRLECACGRWNEAETRSVGTAFGAKAPETSPHWPRLNWTRVLCPRRLPLCSPSPLTRGPRRCFRAKIRRLVACTPPSSESVCKF